MGNDCERMQGLVLDDENVRIGCDDGCIALCVYGKPLAYTGG